jgi:hypothetical protein
MKEERFLKNVLHWSSQEKGGALLISGRDVLNPLLWKRKIGNL